MRIGSPWMRIGRRRLPSRRRRRRRVGPRPRRLFNREPPLLSNVERRQPNKSRLDPTETSSVAGDWLPDDDDDDDDAEARTFDGSARLTAATGTGSELDAITSNFPGTRTRARTTTRSSSSCTVSEDDTAAAATPPRPQSRV